MTVAGWCPDFDVYAAVCREVRPDWDALLVRCHAARIPCLMAVCVGAGGSSCSVLKWLLTLSGDDPSGWAPMDVLLARLLLNGQSEASAAALLAGSDRESAPPFPFDRRGAFAGLESRLEAVHDGCRRVGAPALLAFVTEATAESGRVEVVLVPREVEGKGVWVPGVFARSGELLARPTDGVRGRSVRAEWPREVGG